MKVKLLKTLRLGAGNSRKGEEVEVSQTEAKHLIRRGYAEAADGSTQADPVPAESPTSGEEAKAGKPKPKATPAADEPAPTPEAPASAE